MRTMCFGKEAMYWSLMVKNGVWNAAGLVQMYADKTLPKMKGGVFLENAVRAVLQTSTVKLLQNLIFNGHKLLEFLRVENKTVVPLCEYFSKCFLET